MNPLVSILIPAYNAEAWIAETINSALGQTWPRKEIIVVDDGSTDQTLTVARQFASKGVSVVTQTNQGAAAARNKAYSVCHGDYIQWLDADDLLAPDKIAQQMKASEHMQSRRMLLSSAWGRFIHRSHKAEFSPTLLWCDLSPLEWLLRHMGKNIFMANLTWLVSRELAEAAGPWDTRLSFDDDGEYFCRIVSASDGIRFVPEAMSYYRRSSGDSLSHIGRSNRKLESQFLSMQLHISYLRSLEDSPKVRDACLKYLQTWLIIFYPERLDIVKRLEQIAAELGRKLDPPRLPWKYAWIRWLFGWKLAKSAQFHYNRHKASVLRALGKKVSRLDAGFPQRSAPR